MNEDAANNGQAPDDPSAQGSAKGNKDWGQGRGRADAEEKGDRSADAPKGGVGLGRDRADGGEEGDGDPTPGTASA